MTKLKNIFTIIISSLLLTAILTSLILYIFFSFLDDNFGDQSFNSKLWIENQVHQDYFPRLEMIEDLKENHLKLGMKKSGIINLLGKPDFVVSYI